MPKLAQAIVESRVRRKGESKTLPGGYRKNKLSIHYAESVKFTVESSLTRMDVLLVKDNECNKPVRSSALRLRVTPGQSSRDP